jgi:hypothetical protein
MADVQARIQAEADEMVASGAEDRLIAGDRLIAEREQHP